MKIIKKGLSIAFFIITLFPLTLSIFSIVDTDYPASSRIVSLICYLSVASVFFLIAKYLGENLGVQTLKITMLGASGVGKTSLLTSIYDQFDKIIGVTNLQLIPDNQSRIILDTRLQELKSLVDEISLRAGEGNVGDQQPRKFVFNLCQTGKKASSLKLEFQDFPGGYIELPQHRDSVKTYLKESGVVLIAIDTPALMEREGRWHEDVNKPETVRKLFTEVYQNLNSPRLVIFVPVKCEKYVKNDRDASELLRRIREKYSALLNFFRADALLDKTAVVVTPVQTVGSLEFSRVEKKNNEYYFYYRKCDSIDDPYQPRDTEQPLRYLLRFLLKIHLSGQKIPIVDTFFLNKDKALTQAIDKFGSGCKNTGGFSVLQGTNLL